MDQNIELLTEIYKNADMERAVLGRLIRQCEDAEFRCMMADQFTVYHSIMQATHEALNLRGVLVRDVITFGKRMVFSSMAMHLRIDKTSSHMAEMLVRGNVMGLIDITKALREAEGADEAVVHLAERLRSAQRRHMDQLLRFV
ncbi:MAG: hypothetical protein E7330_06370 [Clostridiales bacterium]|nr:hypothetical protein [Clostridiales bacterium]